MVQLKHFGALIFALFLLVLPLGFAKSTDVQYCNKKGDYAVKVSGVEITPYPISRGEKTTFAIAASTNKSISGGKMTVDVSYLGFHVHNENHDLCKETPCPISAGDFVLSHSQELPGITPPMDTFVTSQHMQNLAGKRKIHDMKKIKGRMLRKLKSISTTTAWKQGQVFQPNTTQIQLFQTPTLGKEIKNLENLIISEISQDVKEEKLASNPDTNNQEKLAPSVVIKPESFGAVPMHNPAQFSARVELEEDYEKTHFEENCHPGGKDSVILYTTSLRGIRKTFDDCNTVRFLLDSFRVLYSERDVSMDLEYRDELWRLLGCKIVPPKLFIRGMFIGGADEVVGLHEKGMLRNMLQGVPLSLSNCPCKGCAGVRFILCWGCNGSQKVVKEGQNGLSTTKCPDCNENGLVKCSVCS